MDESLKRKYFLSILTLLILLYSPPASSFFFHNLGVPVKEGIAWSVFPGPVKTGEKSAIYISLGRYQESLSLLAINPDTGEIKQYNGPLSSEMGSWGWAMDHENRIYLGTYYRAHLLRFDPKTEEWEDLGRPAGETESFICALTTSPDGKIWGGTFPSAKLFSYDPKTGETKDYGRMDEKEFYCYPTAGKDGLIYCAIRFQNTNIVIFDPAKGTRTSLLHPWERRAGWLFLTRGADEKIYAKLPSGKWFQIMDGQHLKEVQESEIPFPRKVLPDGREFHLIDTHLLKIQNPMTREVKEIPLCYEASGAFIFTVGLGPEGKIYGSSMLPLRLFVYDPTNQSLSNLGKAAHSNGEIYSMGIYENKLYMFSYPGSRISVYDPHKPLRFGDDEDSNPKDLGPLGEGQDRPRALVAAPHGKIYIGTYPDYGLHGGALSLFDPRTHEKRIYRHIVPNQSISSLAYIEKLDLVVGGTSIRGGGGTRAIEKQAKLFLWNPKEEQKVFEIVPVIGAKTILSLVVTRGDLVYGITDQEKLFVFDSSMGEVTKVFDLGLKQPLEVSLQPGPDGLLYGLTRDAIFSIIPGKDEVQVLARSPVPITAGMVLFNGKIYFGSHSNLYEFEIPRDRAKPDE